MNSHFEMEYEYLKKSRSLWSVFMFFSLLVYISLSIYLAITKHHSELKNEEMLYESSHLYLDFLNKIMVKTESGYVDANLSMSPDAIKIIELLQMVSSSSGEGVVEYLVSFNFLISSAFLLSILISLSMVRTYHNRIKSISKYFEINSKIVFISEGGLDNFEQASLKEEIIKTYLETSLNDRISKAPFETAISKLRFQKGYNKTSKADS